MISFAFKNHYERLGISRDAPAEDVRKAFRKLARLYHPDVAREREDARELFVLINEAYQVLTDASARSAYDLELKQRWKIKRASANPKPREQPRGPSGMRAAATKFSGGISGHYQNVSWEPVNEKEQERASGFKWKQAEPGKPRARKRSDLDTRADIEIPLSDAINGALHTVTIESDDSIGDKHHLSTYHVRIPAMVWRGQQLRMSGCGINDPLTGEQGDLYLRINYKSHPRFRLMGVNLYTEVEIMPWDAALGAFMQIPTLNGKASLQIPEGVRSGQRFELPGHGVPDRTGSRGKLIVGVKILFPAATSSKQKELWSSLRKAYS